MLIPIQGNSSLANTDTDTIHKILADTDSDAGGRIMPLQIKMSYYGHFLEILPMLIPVVHR